MESKFAKESFTIFQYVKINRYNHYNIRIITIKRNIYILTYFSYKVWKKTFGIQQTLMDVINQGLPDKTSRKIPRLYWIYYILCLWFRSYLYIVRNSRLNGEQRGEVPLVITRINDETFTCIDRSKIARDNASSQRVPLVLGHNLVQY